MTQTIHKESFIAILVNPLSGKGKARGIAMRLQEKLAANNISQSTFIEDWPGGFGGFTEIWIIGGDGTMNYFINRYEYIDLPLVLFKGGTGNDFAWKLYGDITIDAQFDLVLGASPKTVDMASCNGKRYINSLGIGFEGEVLDSMGTIRWMGGHLGYLWAVIRKILSFKESWFSIHTADTRLEGEFLLVNVNNASRTGGGFIISPEAEVNDGLIDMVLCSPLSVLKRLRYLPVIEKGKHLHLPFITFSRHACKGQLIR
jgi:diacylglycerol kinase family enzyme